MTTVEWLASLQEGDEAVVDNGRVSSCARIDRITRTQITCGGMKFRRDNGWHIAGDIYWCYRLQPITEEWRAARRRDNLLIKIRNISWSTISTPQLERIAAILAEETEKAVTQ